MTTHVVPDLVYEGESWYSAASHQIKGIFLEVCAYSNHTIANSATAFIQKSYNICVDLIANGVNPVHLFIGLASQPLEVLLCVPGFGIVDLTSVS